MEACFIRLRIDITTNFNTEHMLLKIMLYQINAELVALGVICNSKSKEKSNQSID